MEKNVKSLEKKKRFAICTIAIGTDSGYNECMKHLCKAGDVL